MNLHPHEHHKYHIHLTHISQISVNVRVYLFSVQHPNTKFRQNWLSTFGGEA
jgi:hypothetical protein